eukprot:COSAG01_NODE_74_length_28433_cov_41.582269_2_plen_114_part_00
MRRLHEQGLRIAAAVAAADIAAASDAEESTPGARGPAPSPAPSLLAELTDENFDEMVASSDIWLVQFSGSACPECDAMRGAMERAAVQLRSAPFNPHPSRSESSIDRQRSYFS